MARAPEPDGSVLILLQLSLGSEPEDAARSRSMGEARGKCEGFEGHPRGRLAGRGLKRRPMQMPMVAGVGRRERWPWMA